MVRIKSVLVVFCMSLLHQGLSAQMSLDLNKFHCFGSEVTYLNEQIQEKGVLFFVNHRDREFQTIQYSNVYLLKEGGQNVQILGDTSALVGVHEALVSPDHKYLALLVVGEGHPWIEVYDLQKLLAQSVLDLKAELNPYPGYIGLHSWQDEKLVVESDINLFLKNEDKDVIGMETSEQSKTYFFDLVSKRYSEYK